MSDRPVPRELLEWARREVGDIAATGFCGWMHAESAVWRLDPSRGRPVFLKAHWQRRKFDQELGAYRRWVPHLDGAAPDIIAVRDDDPLALLLTPALGEVALGGEDRNPSVHRAAGAVLRRLHDVPHDDADPLTLAEAVAARLERYLQRGQGLVDPHVCAWVEDRVTRVLPLLDGATRVPCHRDYTPRNWLVTPAGGFAVIDFEHAVPDLWLLDVERLRSGWWREQDDLEPAFWDGYGRVPTSDDLALLAGVAPMIGLGTVVWALEHRDAAFEAEGWTALRQSGLR